MARKPPMVSVRNRSLNERIGPTIKRAAVPETVLAGLKEGQASRIGKRPPFQLPGWKTQYIHLDDALEVSVGDKVGQGQKIGLVGGAIAIFGTENAHLHYTQWIGSEGVRSVLDGKATAVHAGAKDSKGGYPVEFLTSRNCPVPAPSASLAVVIGSTATG